MEELVVKSGGAKLYTNSEGQGFPVVISDGIWCDNFAPKYLRPFLAHHQTIYWNYLGHGKSSASLKQSDYTLDTFTAGLRAVLDAYGIDRAILCGYSMGALVSLNLAIHYPERVKGLVSICGTYGGPLNYLGGSDLVAKMFPAIYAVINTLPSYWARKVWKAAFSSDAVRNRFVVLGTKSKETTSDMIPYFQHMAELDPKVFIYTLAAIQEANIRTQLEEVQCPTLLLSGGQDTMSPSIVSNVMAQEIPNVRLVTISDATHLMLVEYVDRVRVKIEEFIDANRGDK